MNKRTKPLLALSWLAIGACYFVFSDIAAEGADAASTSSTSQADAELEQGFLRGQELLRARSIQEAITELEAVVFRDPDYAQAWVLLTYAYRFEANRNPALYGGTIEEARTVIEAARQKMAVAAANAMRLEPANPAAIAAQAFVERNRGNKRLAETFYRRALSLDPNDPEILERFSQFLQLVGRTDEAVQLSNQLRELEPDNPPYNINTARALQRDGQDEAAIAILETTDSPDQFFHQIRMTTLSRAFAELGRYEDAAQTLNGMRTNILNQDSVNAAADLLRQASDAPPATTDLPALPRFLDFVYVHVGVSERVMEKYERDLAVQEHGEFEDWSPAFSGLRRSAVFKNYARESGLLEYWRQTEFADLCRPVGEDDFECD
jgi:Tfp pilus assembly protein PilF